VAQATELSLPALAAVAALLVSGCNPKPITEAAATQSEASATPAETCVSPVTYAQLKSMIFDEAQKLATGADVIALQQIGQESTLAVDLAVLDAYDPQTGKVSCSGRLKLRPPPGAIRELGDGDELSFDVRYTAQPGADQVSTVYTLIGTQSLSAGLAAADLSSWLVSHANPVLAPAAPMAPAVVAPEPTVPPPPTFFTTSFDCGKAQSYAELSICSSEELAAADRQLARLYAAALRNGDPAEVRARAREAWRAREACETTECLRTWYRERLSELG